MSYIKQQIENSHPEVFGPEDRVPLSEQDLIDLANDSGFENAVMLEEDRLIARDGPYHVGELYFADLEDAAIQRQWLAEKNVREAARVRDRRARERAERKGAA